MVKDNPISIEYLAKELQITAPKLRAWLRENYPRKKSEKNKKWVLDDEMITYARQDFKKPKIAAKPKTATKPKTDET